MGAFQTPEEEVRHPGTGHERLAQIAQERPDLASAVVWHPNAYDGLLDWIAAHGDEAAKSAIASRRAQAAATPPPPAAPTPPPAAPTPAPDASAPAPAAPTPPPTSAPEAPSYAPPTGGGYTPPADGGYSPPADGGYTPPADGGYPQPAAPAPVHAAPASAYSDPSQPDPMAAPGSVAVMPFGAQAPAKKSRKGLIIGGVITLVLVIALALGAFWAFNTFFRGASSPEAAVDNMLDGVLKGDPVSLMTAFAPSEIDAFKDSFETLTSIETDEFDQEDVMEKLLALHGTLDVEVEGMEYSTDYITDDIAVVYAVKGTIEIDADPGEFADAAVEAVEPVLSAQFESFGYTQGEISRELDDMRDEARDWARDAFPATLDIEETVYDIMRDVGYGDFDVESPFMMVAVDEGGWYISPLLTAAEYVTVGLALDQGVEPSSLRSNKVVDPVHFDTPEDAVAGTARALEDFIAYGETDDLAAVMALPERRVLSLYVPDLPADVAGAVDVWIDEPRTEIEIDGDRARATLLEFAITAEGEGAVEYRNGCFTYIDEYWGDEETFCFSDEPIFGDLGIDELHGTFVKEGGGWLSSPLMTYADYVAIIAEALQEHAERGTLEDLFYDLGTGGDIMYGFEPEQDIFYDFETETF